MPEAQIILNSTDAALTVIREGGGIGMLPTYLSHPYVVSGELVPILDGEQTVRHNILAFWTESRRGNPNVRAFLNFLDDIFPNPTPWNTFYGDEK
ncbi:LysR substrate-binding domain-containing protein [Winslowiella sp. 2C04]|uniref:LysR substrate-binding domain-containing protein n=1 Tax=Winslowiella sp. 2C04 TaxID=3416179 RepID=UPI003CF77B21